MDFEFRISHSVVGHVITIILLLLGKWRSLGPMREVGRGQEKVFLGAAPALTECKCSRYLPFGTACGVAL